MRVRASAGSRSFRRKPTLEKLQQEAQRHLEELKLQNENESERQAVDAKKAAAMERAAKERAQRIAEAIRQHQELSEQREKRKKGDGEKTRVSTTDPDARKMKMPNGGFDAAFNVQFASDADARVIVGIAVTNEGADGGQMPPMVEQVSSDYGKRPQKVLVDSASATKDSVTQVAFRARMSQEKYQSLYKQRPSIAEFPNADCRNRGLRQFRVRGLPKVKAVALWHALALNFTRMINLEVLVS